MIFSDEKKFTLDDPDGMTHYWRDLHTEAKYFPTRNFGGGSTMVWGSFSSYGAVELQFVSSRMNSKDYTKVLKTSLLLYINKFPYVSFEYQQDNASIHVSMETKRWCKTIA